jgi:amino acid permease
LIDGRQKEGWLLFPTTLTRLIRVAWLFTCPKRLIYTKTPIILKKRQKKFMKFRKTIKILTLLLVVVILSLLMVRGYRVIFPTIIMINDPINKMIRLGLGLVVLLGLLTILTIYRDYCQYRDFYMDPEAKIVKNQQKEKRLERIRNPISHQSEPFSTIGCPILNL